MSLSVIVAGASGRMGTAIAELVRREGDTLAAVLERPEKTVELESWGVPVGSDPQIVLAQHSGVVIDFTTPKATLAAVHAAVTYKRPMVVGTTGFTEKERDELEQAGREIPLFWSPNMSVGVNVLLEVLPVLTRMLGPDYDLEVVEIHHNRKKDAPSGTALRLAECLAEARDQKLKDVMCCERKGIIGERPKAQVGIQTVRGGDVVGVHTVYFIGNGERIEVTHHAHSRDNFARGALRAAHWLVRQKPGLYAMTDMLHA